MTLKELLAEVEKVQSVNIRSNAQVRADLNRCEMELMPGLARRLKRAIEGLRAANTNSRVSHIHEYDGVKFVGYDAGPCPPDCPAKIVEDALIDATGPSMTIRERLRETPGEDDVVTQDCPNCGSPMMRSETSHGWFCKKTCGQFLPDDCV